MNITEVTSIVLAVSSATCFLSKSKRYEGLASAGAEIVDEGYFEIPTGPGLGVTLDEEVA